VAGCDLYPRPACLTVLHLERRERQHWMVAMADAADERLSRKGPVNDGEHTGTEAIEKWRESKAAIAPGADPAQSMAESPGATDADSESAETTLQDTEQVSEKPTSPFVARWRARLKRVHSDHG
jgi:hypothetical protein